MGLYETSIFLYELFLIPVIFFSTFFFTLTISSIILKPNRHKFNKKITTWPSVTIQLPTYNDPIVIRCIKHCLRFDYPKDKFDIIVADDSTDEKTTKLVMRYAKEYPDRIKLIRRNSREGFKAGALNNALKFTKGEIIVIFDADFTPPKNFLKKVVKPLIEDENVVFVQSRMGYININQNLITKIASIFLMFYHNTIVPINDKLGIALFCGTGGAIRKKALLEIGGWNEKSITEDTDLSLKLFNKGYKSIYLPNLRASGELPFTLKSFIRQQMRWAYGNTRAFIEHISLIWINKIFSLKQKIMLTFTTAGNLISLFVVAMTFFGFVSMFTGTPHPLTFREIMRFFTTFLATSGFMVLSFLGMKREGRLDLAGSFLISSMTIGLIISTTNSLAVIEAILNRKMTWFKTPKYGNLSITKWFKQYLLGKRSV